MSETSKKSSSVSVKSTKSGKNKIEITNLAGNLTSNVTSNLTSNDDDKNKIMNEKNLLKLSHVKKLKNYKEVGDIDLDKFMKNIPYNDFPSTLCSQQKDLDELREYKIKGVIEINSCLNDSGTLYVFVKKDSPIIFGFNDIPKLFWHTIETREDFVYLLSVYDNAKYKKDFTERKRVYIGNKSILNFDFFGFHRYFMLSKYCETTMWNSDFPNKKNMNKLSTLDTVSMMANNIDDNLHELSVHSKYSKSLVKIESHNGHYIADVMYNPIKCGNSNVPADVSSLFVNFLFMDMNEILSMPQLTPTQIDICVLLADDNKSTIELIELLNKITPNASDSKIVKYIEFTIKKLRINNYFYGMEKDGVFRAFENSLDILMKTVYEQCDTDENNDSPVDTKIDTEFYDVKFYIDEMLKHKLMNIISNRIMV